jgi:protein ImuB
MRADPVAVAPTGATGPAIRTMVVWCADWPVVAAGAHPDDLAAVLTANRVVACTPAARRVGVGAGQRRREAQGRCSGLVVHERDESAEARAFEPVVQAVETFTPRLELTRPGVVTFATRGPSRYFGGDEALAGHLLAQVDAVLAPLGWSRAAGPTLRIGVADGPFAAGLAARRGTGLRGPNAESGALPPGWVSTPGITIIPPGDTPRFLAPRSVHLLDRPELSAVLARLGVLTLGDLAALPAADVVARFGADGVTAHRLAAGLDERPPAAADPPADLTVTAELDPPAERVDAAAFVAKAMAAELFAALAARGLSCTRVLVAAETAHGERIERLWRHEGELSAGAVTDRVRWQLDGWLHAATGRPTAGIAVLRLVPDEVVPAHGRQLGFWGGEREADRQAVRALARVQGLLGPDAVLVPEWRGGRGPAEQLTLVPAAAVDLVGERPAVGRSWRRAPWPGGLPPPAPAVVLRRRWPAAVVDGEGLAVTVDARGGLSGAPARLAVTAPERPPGEWWWSGVAGWAGPWPVDERWWDPPARRRRARFQVVTAAGDAFVLVLEGGRWWVEALYD